jgi:hypothetical protein
MFLFPILRISILELHILLVLEQQALRFRSYPWLLSLGVAFGYKTQGTTYMYLIVKCGLVTSRNSS